MSACSQNISLDNAILPSSENIAKQFRFGVHRVLAIKCRNRIWSHSSCSCAKSHDLLINRCLNALDMGETIIPGCERIYLLFSASLKGTMICSGIILIRIFWISITLNTPFKQRLDSLWVDRLECASLQRLPPCQKYWWQAFFDEWSSVRKAEHGNTPFFPY